MEVETRLAGWAKGHAIRQGILDAMDAEELIGLANTEYKGKTKVMPDTCLKWVAVREKWSQVAAAKKVSSCEEMNGMIKSTSAKLAIVDATWRVEKAILGQVAGDGCVARTHQLVVAMFPTEEAAKNANQVLTQVTTLTTKSGMKFAPRSVTEAMQQIIRWLKQLVAGEEIKISSVRLTAMASDIAARMGHFLRVKITAGEAVTSHDAMKLLVNQALTKHSAGQFTIADCADFVKFKYLIAADKLEQMQTCIATAKKNDTSEGKIKISSSSSKVSATAAKDALLAAGSKYWD